MLLSIIIPVYNVEKYLGICLQSVLKLKDFDYELLLIDDGSTDKSSDICDKYANNYSFVKVFHVKNGGPSKARNIGIEHAQGEYIQFVDSDDEVDASYLSEFMKLAKHRKPDIIIGETDIVDNNKTIKRHLSMNKVISVEELINNLGINEKEISLHYIWNKWYKRDVIVKNSILFNENVSLGEDFLFNCSFFISAVSIEISSATIYIYYIRDNLSLTGRFRKNELERRRFIDSKYIELLSSKNAYQKNKDKVNAQIGAITFESLMSISKKSCPLDFKDKISFVKGFVESEYGDYIRAFRLTDDSKLWQKLIILMLNKKRYSLAVKMMVTKSKIKL